MKKYKKTNICLIVLIIVLGILIGVLNCGCASRPYERPGLIERIRIQERNDLMNRNW